MPIDSLNDERYALAAIVRGPQRTCRRYGESRMNDCKVNAKIETAVEHG